MAKTREVDVGIQMRRPTVFEFGLTIYLGSLSAIVVFSYFSWQKTQAAESHIEVQNSRFENLVSHVKKVSPSAPAERIVKAVTKSGEKYGVDAALILSLIQVESDFRADAQSEAPARGLMQLVETTAARQGLPWELAYDIELNVDAGSSYFAEHLKTYKGRIDLALLRYNGHGHPKADPHFARKVLAIYRQFHDSLVVTVREGDTLAKIAETYLGDVNAYHLLAAYNQILEPDQLTVGQSVAIPRL